MEVKVKVWTMEATAFIIMKFRGFLKKSLMRVQEIHVSNSAPLPLWYVANTGYDVVMMMSH